MDEIISVIVPIFKVEQYLPRCIESIINQTYKKLEIILVNDGSPDNCGAICDNYALKDARIRVIHKNNGGLSDARNAGIDIAQGNYITFIDSDDWIHPKYIEFLYNTLKKNNADISVCNFLATSSENVYSDKLSEDIKVFNNFQALEQLTDKLYVQMVIACGKLFKRELFNNIRFPLKRIHEDEFTTYKLLYEANKIVYTNNQLYYYWQRENSITKSKFNIKSRIDAMDAFIERAEFFKSIGLPNLSYKTYRQCFLIYIGLKRRMKRNNIFNDYNIDNYFEILNMELKDSKHDLIFKIIYKLYLLNPRIVDILFSIKNKVKK